MVYVLGCVNDAELIKCVYMCVVDSASAAVDQSCFKLFKREVSKGNIVTQIIVTCRETKTTECTTRL